MSTVEDAYSRAAEIGAADGLSAASWFFDGNTSRETFVAILAGIDDGDPAILDTLPAPDLSGEWADSRTPRSLAAACGLTGEHPDVLDIVSGLCDEYEQAFNRAADAEIVRVATLQTTEENQ